MSVSENFKERIKLLKKHITPLHVIIFSLSAFIAALSVAVYQFGRAESYRTAIDNQHLRAIAELTSFVQNIEHNLTKGIVVTDAGEMAEIASSVYAEAGFASSALSQLPSHSSLINTAEFLSQVGDFTKSLSKRYVNGEKISDKEYETLENFISYAENLHTSLSALSEDIYGRRISLGELYVTDAGKFESKNAELSAIINETENNFESFPTLIYDGPFSDHLKKHESALLSGRETISKATAEEEVKKLMGKNFSGEISYTGENSGSLPTYNFSVKQNSKDERSIAVEITKSGGMVALILDSRIPSSQTLTIDDAKKNAHSFLGRYDFGKMQDTYYEIQNGVAVINFAYTQNGVICYPDLVKVKVALDNGEILGIECGGYISNHRTREIPSFACSDAQIKEKISPKAEVSKISKCLIPTKGGGEIFCYEVLCKYKDKNFLVYLNCETLRQEEILMLLVTENGNLTI